MTIDVTDSFVVHRGQGYAFTDETGFLLSGDAAPTLVNAGAMSLRVTAAQTDGPFAVHAVADNATIWNKAGGQISASGAAGAGHVWAIYLEGASNLLRNAGDVLVRGDSASVVASGGQDLDIDNSGRLDARGGGEAVTLLLHTDNQIVNTGVISARGDQATGLAVLAGPAGQLDNSGLIIARGGASACAVSFYFTEGGYRLTNSGHIVAVADPEGHSLAIYLQPHHDGAPASVIDNSGTIRAEVALRVNPSFGDVIIDNSGKLVGEIDLGYGADRLVNTGLIRGDINLEYGDDSYDGTDGRLIGSLMGGRGADTLTGGLDSDSFRYDQLADSTLISSDLITNLQSTDVIDLSRIDADASTDGQQHLTAGQVALTFDAASGNTWLDVDTGGVAGPEMRIVISGDHTDFTGILL